MVNWPPKGCKSPKISFYVTGPNGWANLSASIVGEVSPRDYDGSPYNQYCGMRAIEDKEDFVWLCEDCAKRGGYIW